MTFLKSHPNNIFIVDFLQITKDINLWRQAKELSGLSDKRCLDKIKSEPDHLLTCLDKIQYHPDSLETHPDKIKSHPDKVAN